MKRIISSRCLRVAALAASSIVAGWNGSIAKAQNVAPSAQPGILANRKIDEAKATYFVSVNGSDAADGRTRVTAFATLQKAADAVQPGQTVLVTKGVYKQGVHIKKEGRADAWISFVAEPGAVIEGADVRKDWARETGEAPIYSIARPDLIGNVQQLDTKLQDRVEQIFVNGVLLRQVPERAMLKPKGVFWVDDAAKKLYVALENGANPNEQNTEVSMRTYAIAIGAPPNLNFWREERIGLENKAAYIRLDGFTVRHMANFSRMAAIQVRGLCNNIVIENCDVQWTNFAGIGAASLNIWSPQENKWIDQQSHHITIRNCVASNNGVQGMGGGGVSDFLIESNVIDNNNYKGYSPWAEGGAVKVAGATGTRVVMRNNVARNNDNHGLWFDYASTDCVFENNFIYSSMAGGILNEVTPPGLVERANDKQIVRPPTAEEVLKMHADGKVRGTIIRNNIIIGTRAPTGGGINISNSVMSDIYNNILYGNSGHGISFGGAANRIETRGLWGNKARSNIFDNNFLHAVTAKDSEDAGGRYFDNVFESNLFLRAKAKVPFRISGKEATLEEWKSVNNNAENFYADKGIFRDPEHFDFTLTDEALAQKAGFDKNAIRLDWSAFYLAPTQRETRVEARDYQPIDISKLFNRALSDEIANDAKGGWTDQGGNDMSLFPTGLQTLDSVQYALGTKERGALLLDSPNVKPSNFPAEVQVPVGKAFEEINLLYSSAYTPNSGEVARFVVNYEDKTTLSIPIISGRHVLDWWADPTWQQYAALNDNNVYVAWQGPNREAGKVTAYYLKWSNPNPEKKIASITISNRDAAQKAAFFVLGMTGATRKTGGDSSRVFSLNWDDTVDAVNSADSEIEAQGFNRAAFDAGSFVEGVAGKAFIPKKPTFYPVPADFPLGGQGAISMWLKADDWTTEKRIADYRGADYKRTMTPLSTHGETARFAAWGVSFEIDKALPKQLTMKILLSGSEEKFDVTNLIKSGEWFHLAVAWEPRADGKNGHTRRTYFNEILLTEKSFDQKVDLIGESLYLGVPRNGGQPWVGAMDELSIQNVALSAEQIVALQKKH